MGTKVFLVGKQLVDYEDRKTGEAIKGYKLYFFCSAPGVHGNLADNVWIDYKRSPEVFSEVQALDFNTDDFIRAELVYNVIPGRRSQQLMHINIL